MPAPTAPELTRATLRPVAVTAEICSARWSILEASSDPSGAVRTLVPTFTTQVWALNTTSSRTRSRTATVADSPLNSARAQRGRALSFNARCKATCEKEKGGLAGPLRNVAAKSRFYEGCR